MNIYNVFFLYSNRFSMVEVLSSRAVGIQRVILLFLIGSQVGRFVWSVSLHPGKLWTP